MNNLLYFFNLNKVLGWSLLFWLFVFWGVLLIFLMGFELNLLVNSVNNCIVEVV